MAIVAESIRGGVGLIAVSDYHRARRLGLGVVVVGPELRPEDHRVAQVLGDAYLALKLPSNAARHPFAVVRARQQVRAVLRGRGVDVVHVHGLRGALFALPWRRAVLTYHGATSLSRGGRVLRALVLAIVPALVDRALTAVELRSRAWRYVWLRSPNLPQHAEVAAASTLTMLWLGRISAQKRFDQFVEMVELVKEAHPDAVAQVAGEIDVNYDEGLIHRARHAGIKFLGNVNDVGALLAGDVIVYLFSHFEAKTFTVEEALAAGRPVIASDLPGIRPMIGRTESLVTTANQAARATLALAEPNVRLAVGQNMHAEYLRRRAAAVEYADEIDRLWLR